MIGIADAAPSLVVPRTQAALPACCPGNPRARIPAVTAFAAVDDDVALRILAAARDLGLSVPGDVAVIGFDDTHYGALFTPTLTTVHIEAAEHGRQAARVVLGLDSDVFAPSPAQVIVRESA